MASPVASAPSGFQNQAVGIKLYARSRAGKIDFAHSRPGNAFSSLSPPLVSTRAPADCQNTRLVQWHEAFVVNWNPDHVTTFECFEFAKL